MDMMEVLIQASPEPAYHETGRIAFERAFRDCESRLGRPATNLEVCDELGLCLKDLYSLLDLNRGLGLGCVEDFVPGAAAEGELESLVRYVPDPSQPEAFCIYSKAEFRVAMMQAIDALPKNEKLVVSLYHNENLSMHEIAKIFGISEVRVAQIHTTAILRIRGRLSSLQEV
jgi:RNA polymerase sigma factor for flagellar operon FliA